MIYSQVVLISSDEVSLGFIVGGSSKVGPFLMTAVGFLIFSDLPRKSTLSHKYSLHSERHGNLKCPLIHASRREDKIRESIQNVCKRF